MVRTLLARRRTGSPRSADDDDAVVSPGFAVEADFDIAGATAEVLPCPGGAFAMELKGGALAEVARLAFQFHLFGVEVFDAVLGFDELFDMFPGEREANGLVVRFFADHGLCLPQVVAP